MNTENSQTNEHIALANLSTYYTWKNIKSAYNNNEIKTNREIDR